MILDARTLRAVRAAAGLAAIEWVADHYGGVVPQGYLVEVRRAFEDGLAAAVESVRPGSLEEWDGRLVDVWGDRG